MNDLHIIVNHNINLFKPSPSIAQVRKRTLIMIHHRPDGIVLEANADIDAMFANICERKPLFGEAFPKEFLSFMFFGKGCILTNAVVMVFQHLMR